MAESLQSVLNALAECREILDGRAGVKEGLRELECPLEELSSALKKLGGICTHEIESALERVHDIRLALDQYSKGGQEIESRILNVGGAGGQESRNAEGQESRNTKGGNGRNAKAPGNGDFAALDENDDVEVSAPPAEQDSAGASPTETGEAPAPGENGDTSASKENDSDTSKESAFGEAAEEEENLFDPSWSPKPWVEGGRVESRWLYNEAPDGSDARVFYQFDANGTLIGVEGRFGESNIFDTRGDRRLNSMDATDRSKYRKDHKGLMDRIRFGKKEKLDAGHIVNSKLLEPVHQRILNCKYDVSTAFLGEHAEAAVAVDKMREMIEANPNLTWAKARRNLSKDEKAALDKLERAERDLNFIPQLAKLNRGAFYQTFEKPMLDMSGQRGFRIELNQVKDGRVGKINVSFFQIKNGKKSSVITKSFDN